MTKQDQELVKALSEWGIGKAMGGETLFTKLKPWESFAGGREHVKEFGQGAELRVIIILSTSDISGGHAEDGLAEDTDTLWPASRGWGTPLRQTAKENRLGSKNPPSLMSAWV